MSTPNIQTENLQLRSQKRFYLQIKYKFAIANLIALAWLFLSLYISYPWVIALSRLIGGYPAWHIVIFIALIPGYLNMFLLLSLLLDKPAKLNLNRRFPSITLLMAAYNEEKCIAETLRSIRQQDYPSNLEVIIVDDGSSDKTTDIILNSGMPNVRLIKAQHGGKAAALNLGIEEITNDYVITIDADTFLHPQAVRRIMSRILGAPGDTAAVAGCVLTKNSRNSFITRLQEWDYFLAISSIKRQQALFQGTLVAQGAFSVYRTKVVREVNGWPDCIGEDIVVTWAMIKAGYRVGFESTAIGFTEVPVSISGFAKQRRRWARGMIEGFKNHYQLLFKNIAPVNFLVALDLLFPILDVTYTFAYIPGIILAFFGFFWIVGPMTLAVLPLTLLTNYIMYRYQRGIFSILKLRIRRNRLGFICYTLVYQILMSPVCVWGYAEEILGRTKKW